MKDIAWYGGLGAIGAFLIIAGIFGIGGQGGLAPSEIAATYTRPGTGIKIIIATAQAYFGYPGVGQDFSATQISLMEMALDTLTIQQLNQTGVAIIIPAPQKFHDSGKFGSSILLDPNDPNLITDL